MGFFTVWVTKHSSIAQGHCRMSTTGDVKHVSGHSAGHVSLADLLELEGLHQRTSGGHSRLLSFEIHC